jgi:hypothetical protein
MKRLLTTLVCGLLLTSLHLAIMPTMAMGQVDFGSNPVIYVGPHDLFGQYTGRPGSVTATPPSFQLLSDGFTLSGPAYTVTAPAGTADITTLWSADRLYQGTLDFGRILGETTVTTSGFNDQTTLTLEVHGRTVQYETDSGGIDFATFTQDITRNGISSVHWDMSGINPPVNVTDDALELYSRIILSGAPAGASVSLASTYGISALSVPEPASWTLLGSAAICLLAYFSSTSAFARLKRAFI